MAAISYCALSDVTAYGKITSSDSGDDARITTLIDRASRWIDGYTGWTFGQETVTNGVFSLAEGRARIDRDGQLWVTTDLPVVTAVTAMGYRLSPQLGYTAVDGTAIMTFPTVHGNFPSAVSHRVMAAVSLAAYRTAPFLQVQMSYTGGYGTIPSDIVHLAVRLTWWMYQQAKAPFEKIAQMDGGTVAFPMSVPPDIVELGNRWRRFA